MNKFYKLSDDIIFEIVEKIKQENAAYTLKCKKALLKERPYFQFGEEFFIVLSYGAVSMLEEITEDEANDLANKVIKDSWTKVQEISKKGGAFLLPVEAEFSRDWYMKAYKSDRDGFVVFLKDNLNLEY